MYGPCDTKAVIIVFIVHRVIDAKAERKARGALNVLIFRFIRQRRRRDDLRALVPKVLSRLVAI